MNIFKKAIKALYLRYCAKKHKYPPSCLVHRKLNGSLVFEIEFNWYDENYEPVSIVRDIKTTKVFSIRYLEMKEFVEYTGLDGFSNGGFQ